MMRAAVIVDTDTQKLLLPAKVSHNRTTAEPYNSVERVTIILTRESLKVILAVWSGENSGNF